MRHPPANKLDPAQVALALLLLWGVLAPSVACTSRAAGVGAPFERKEYFEAR
jgi:hypothetical protein